MCVSPGTPLPSPSTPPQLQHSVLPLKCEMSKSLISEKHTAEPEETERKGEREEERERRHGRGRETERKKERQGERQRERKKERQGEKEREKETGGMRNVMVEGGNVFEGADDHVDCTLISAEF